MTRTMHSLYASLLGCLLLAALLSPGSAAAQFTQDDVTGSWHYYGRWDSPAAHDPGWDRGTFVFDSVGNVTSGSSTDHAGEVTTYTGGNLSINALGLLSGTISTSEGSDAISNYKVTPSANLVVGVDTDPDGYVSLDLVVKAGGSFSTADLAGTWRLYAHWDLPAVNDPGWDRGTLVINSSGTVTATTGVDSDGETLNLTGLSLSINSSTGVITSVALTGELKMTLDKGMIVGVNLGEDAYVALVVMVKTGGTFSTSDLAGRWYAHTFTDAPAPAGNDPTWERLLLDVSATGAITGGSGMASDGGSDTVTGGSFSLDSSGVMSGSIEFSLREDIVVTDFKMNADHEVMVGVTTDSDGYRSLSVVVVPEATGTAGLLAAIGTLAALKRKRRFVSR